MGCAQVQVGGAIVTRQVRLAGLPRKADALLHAALLRKGSSAAAVPALSTAFLAGYLVTWAAFSVAAVAAIISVLALTSLSARASAAVGAYGAVQSSLVLTACSDELRGRAMGLLSMAIGGLPIGMYLLGETAQHIGAPAALTLFNIVGVVVLALFLRRRPEAYSEI